LAVSGFFLRPEGVRPGPTQKGSGEAPGGRGPGGHKKKVKSIFHNKKGHQNFFVSDLKKKPGLFVVKKNTIGDN